jgi:peroxiredoxin
LQLSIDEIGKRGGAVAGVVVDPVETNATLAREAGIEYPILSDPDMRLIGAYGLRHAAAHDGRDIALSASILVDGDGIVRWTSVSENVRVRPTPAEVLAKLDALPRR